MTKRDASTTARWGLLTVVALLFTGCDPPFAFDEDLGSHVSITGPDDRLCTDGTDGSSLVICKRVGQIDGVDYEAVAIAKGLGESLEVRTNADDEIGGNLTAKARLYQTFVVSSEAIAVGTLVDLLFVADLGGFFLEGPTGEAIGPSRITWLVEIWTEGCDATGCGAPIDPTVLVDEAAHSGDAFGVFRSIEELLFDLAVGDVFGVRAELSATSEAVAGLRVGADFNADFDLFDPDPDENDGPRVRAVRFAAP